MPESISLECLLPECRAYARSICYRYEDAEDLVQDAMLRALRSPSLTNSVADLRLWLFRVIRNLYYDELRKLRVQRDYLLDEQIFHDKSITPNHERDVYIRRAFNQLPPDFREVLFLVDVLGLKYREAAEIIDVPHGTIMSRVSRARGEMFERVEGNNAQIAGKDVRK